MPSRVALLISNAGEPGDEHYCKGVAIDVANYRRFLSSAHGGAWKDSEVIGMDKPTKVALREAITAVSTYDYSFVAFAGHGYYSKIDKATVLKLQKGVEVSSLELYKGATKRTLVLDCCREIKNKSPLLLEKSANLSAARAEALYRRVPNPARCRAHFDANVSSASNGIVVLHSCTPGETAGDDERTGGYYTFQLIGAADTWAKTISENGALLIPAAMSVVRAHDSAASATTEGANQRIPSHTQNPTIEKPRTANNYFPFAVFV